jgi:hypothetical protein
MHCSQLQQQHILRDKRYEKLIGLGSEKLAFSLLELAIRNQSVNEFVDRLCSNKQDNLKRFYEKLEKIQRQKYFYEWRERNIFISQLEDLIKLLEDSASSPQEGVKGIFALFEADESICESCHDDGEIGMFYDYDVCELLVHYAVDCEDKEWMTDEIIRLCRNDNYGCRYCLHKHIPKFLLPSQIERILAR